MRNSNDKRAQLDDLKTAYHVANLVEQAGWLRRNWDSVKGDLFEFMLFAAAAGIALLVGYLAG